MNGGESADGWAAARTVFGAIGTVDLVVVPLLALIASERVIRRFSVPVAALAARSVTTLVATPLLVVAAIVAAAALATTAGALVIDDASADFEFQRQPGSYWLALAILAATAVLTIVTVRLAISRGDLDETGPSDNWTRSGVATRAVALFVGGASMTWFFALGAFSNVGWGYRDADAPARRGWEWVESAHVLGLSQLLQGVAMVLIIIAFVTCAKPPVKIPRAVVSAVAA